MSSKRVQGGEKPENQGQAGGASCAGLRSGELGRPSPQSGGGGGFWGQIVVAFVENNLPMAFYEKHQASGQEGKEFLEEEAPSSICGRYPADLGARGPGPLPPVLCMRPPVWKQWF